MKDYHQMFEPIRDRRQMSIRNIAGMSSQYCCSKGSVNISAWINMPG